MPTARPRKLTLNDLETYRVVSDAQIHPDSSCTAFVVGDLTHPRGKTTRSNIYLTDSAGDNTRAFTSADACEVQPRWSPDGKTLAFVSDRSRSDDYQIYLIPAEGGEAAQLTHGSPVHAPYRDITIFKWSPDGKQIAFMRKDARPEQLLKRRAQGYDEIVFEGRPRFMRVWIVDVATRKTRLVTRGDVQVWEFDWSADGKDLALICSAQPYEWSWYDAWLARVPARGGIPRKIFARPDRQLAHPRWSPDGHHIAFVSSLWSDRGIIGGDVYLTDTNGKNARVLSEGYPGTVGALRWIDNQNLLSVGYLQGDAAVTQFDIEGVATTIWRGEGAMQESFAPKFSRAKDGTLAVIRSGPNMPREVWLLDFSDPDAVVWQQLTDLNRSFQDVVTGEHEIVEWQGAGGKPMQGLLIKPVGARKGKRLPMVVHPHGGPTGNTPNEFMSPHRWAYHLANRGIAVFMPNYRGSTGWGVDFAEANLGDMGGDDFKDIMKGVDALVERGIADPKRLGFGGWSYGGFLTAWAISSQSHTSQRPADHPPIRFKAAVVGAGITNWLSFHGTSYLNRWDEIHYNASPYERDGVFQKFSPINYVDNITTPTLILHGEKDGDVPVSQGHELFRALKDRGIETEFVIYPHEPHAVGETAHVKDLITRVCDWFERYLK